MATKPKKADKQEDEQLARKHLQVNVLSDDSKDEQASKYAKMVMSPELAAYRIIKSADGESNIFNGVDVPSLVDKLREQSAAVNRGEFNHIEAMLMNQATGLQSLYARLTERALCQEHMPNFEAFMRMALRAQNQCRATLETLAAIKNPPVVFAKQANINHGNGNQQVNNGTPPADTARTGKTINQQNELLTEGTNNETLDTRGTAAAIRTNPAMATVG
jgi:hypothetical protein